MCGRVPFAEWIHLHRYLSDFALRFLTATHRASLLSSADPVQNFLVVSDPVIAKYILQDQSGIYSKGILGEILKPIMGEGLIPAKPEVAAKRRRVVVPAVHNAYLKRMMRTFSETAWELADEVEGKIGGGGGSAGQQGWPPHSASDLLQSHAVDSEHHGRYILDMEQQFNHVTLDIVGRAVFNWDFGTVTSVEETDLVKAVYGVMSEADHRATFFLPYWNVPVLGGMVPRQRRFRKALGLLNGQLDELIGAARAACEAEGGREDLELLQARDYENVKDPSMLRFLVDMRGEEAGDKQLRDDLMTLLIAGHETTSSVLTWLLFELSQRPALMAEVVAEVDAVMAPLERGLAEGERPVLGLDDVKALKLLRVAFAETLRLYPQPPLLIRRALKEDNNVPKGCAMAKGSDIFISSYNIHRSKALYGEDVLDFNPKRWLSDFGQGQVEGWAGYSAEAMGLYPNEKSTDFAFLPFGAGNRKCIGDVFAVAEGVTIMAVILRRFRFELAIAPEEVGMVTAATIHTESGLVMSAERRTDV